MKTKPRLSITVTTKQRAFLKKDAAQRDLSIGAIIRGLIDIEIEAQQLFHTRDKQMRAEIKAAISAKLGEQPK